MSKWQKILLGIAGGVMAVSTVIPGVNLVTLPIVGAITAKAAAVGVATFLTGWATRTPDHSHDNQAGK